MTCVAPVAPIRLSLCRNEIIRDFLLLCQLHDLIEITQKRWEENSLDLVLEIGVHPLFEMLVEERWEGPFCENVAMRPDLIIPVSVHFVILIKTRLTTPFFETYISKDADFELVMRDTHNK